MNRRMVSLTVDEYQELLKFKLALQVKLGRSVTYSEVIKHLLENQHGI